MQLIMTGKRLYIVFLLSVLFPFLAMSQTYSSLWKQYDKACEKDLPKDELAVLAKIRDKAYGDNAYGQLLKAELQTISVQSMVSPDSLLPQLKRYETAAAKAGDTALGAVYYSTLGHIYKNYGVSLDMQTDSANMVSRRYYKRSLAAPGVLAAAKAGTYEPLVADGRSSSVFGDDLLHVLAMEAEDYELMHDYYDKAGNRAAACISAYYQTQKERADDVRLVKKSKYLATIDSLINVYRDLPEAGELAIEHFNYLDGATDASAREKVEYIDYALLNWPSWPRMAVLKNARNRLTLPSFNVSISKSLVTPGQEIPVYITSLTHLDRLQMNVYKVNITGAETFNPNDPNDYNTLRSKLSSQPAWSDSRAYYGLPEYFEVRDTMKIAPLPVGVYMVEFTTDNDDVAVERAMLYVSNLRLVCMSLPKKKKRIVALDATTGKPVPGAKVTIKFNGWQNNKWSNEERTLTTEKDGEVVFSSTLPARKYLLTTDTDKAFPWNDISDIGWFSSSELGAPVGGQYAEVFTDRALYRPGQSVKLSVIAYNTFSQGRWETADTCTVHVALRNSKYKIIEEKDIVTDEWGVASAEFTLPDDCPTGNYSIRSQVAGTYADFTSFRVEEYKRPTFSVTFDDYKEAYKEGDTIRVKGWAKTYSGVAVQNATVKYSVSSIYSSWVVRQNTATGIYHTAEAVTGNDGSFIVDVPLKMPDETNKGRRFAYVTLRTTVTDGAGESHSAKVNYPLSDKPAAFMLQKFSDKQCREQQEAFTFTYLNNSGQKIDADMTYCVDAGAPVPVKTNTETTLNLDGITSGRHLLTAFCNNDTLKQEFIVFSLKDTKAPVDTTAWYYSTKAGTWTPDLQPGVPGYIQIGTTQSDQTVLYVIATDSAVLEAGQMVLNDEVKTYPLEYKEEWGNGAVMMYAWARNGELYTFTQGIARPAKMNKLTLEWKTFRDKLAPGQEEEWVLTVKNADGTPAKAHTLAVMYDKSLDALEHHVWALDHNVVYTPPSMRQLADYHNAAKQLYGEQTLRYLQEPQLEFSHLDMPYFYGGMGELCSRTISFTGSTSRLAMPSKKVMAAALTNFDAMEDSSGEGSDVVVAGVSNATATADDATGEIPVEIRENLNETAFFMPQLVTDKSGNVSIKFKLPESLTTWQFMALSHDKQMCTGRIFGEAVAQKKLMIKPNMPRFIRVGDKAQLSAVITNNSDRDLSGKAYVQLLRSSDRKAVANVETRFNVKAGQQTPVTFSLPSNLSEEVYVCSVVAQTSGFSDGEQSLLPILSDKVEVTTTRAFTQVQPGTKTIDVNALYGTNASRESLKVEYTNNPAWLMLEALPAVGNPDSENAISLATALYANSITEKIKAQMPLDTTTAKLTTVSTSRLIGQLANLQNVNGSFSWFKGMTPSRYVTQAVAKLLARIKHLGLADSSVKPMLQKTMDYLDTEVARYVSDLKKMEKNSKSKPVPSDAALDYLYIQSINGDAVEGTAASNASYLLSLTDKISPQLSLYGKANMAIVSALHPVKKNRSMATQLLESVRQYTVQTEDMGRYFDTSKAHYSWCDYRIPTQTAAIEALQTLTPSDRQTIADMQQWLLQEKHTQQWNTTLNTASAIYAFFNGWDFSGEAKTVAEATGTVESTRLFVDNSLLTGGEQVDGKGYFCQTVDGRHSTFRAEKTSDNISWGAVYATCTQPVDDVLADGESLSVKREILDANGNKLTSTPQTGQTVTVRLTVVAKRDLDFVEITDNRAACLEPVNQTSGYRRGYYEAPRDERTTYYFDKFAKGKHVMETTYYIDRAGDYKSGLATAKCLYAPEFQARDKALTIETK